MIIFVQNLYKYKEYNINSCLNLHSNYFLFLIKFYEKNKILSKYKIQLIYSTTNLKKHKHRYNIYYWSL